MRIILLISCFLISPFYIHADSDRDLFFRRFGLEQVYASTQTPRGERISLEHDYKLAVSPSTSPDMLRWTEDRLNALGRLHRMARAGAKAAAAPGTEVPFKWGEVYVYPNPARRKTPVFHAEVGAADEVRVRVFDAAGRLVHEGGMVPALGTSNGRYAYEHAWDVSSQAAGVYGYVVTARRGRDSLTRTGKAAVIK
jgi:hypothetical protein